jgi:TPR repeat protein
MIIDQTNVTSASSADPQAVLKQGKRLYTKNPTMSLALIERAASMGLAEAQFEAGWLYADGHGIDRDPFKAIQYLAQASRDSEQREAVLLFLKTLCNDRHITLREKCLFAFAAAAIEDSQNIEALQCDIQQATGTILSMQP